MPARFGIHTQNPRLINKVERIQRNAARFTKSDYWRETNATNLIQQLKWDTLHTRRIIQQQCMLYKIHYDLVNITIPHCFQRASRISLRLSHPLNYTNLNPPSIDAHKFSFFPRSVQIWNRLPAAAVLHINPSLAVFHTVAAPAIRVLKPQFGATIL